VKQIEIPIWEVQKIDDKLHKEIIDYFSVKQENQIFNIGDFCNECGNCDTFCPTNGAPYKTKPHFYLTEESFESEDTGYYISGKTLKFKLNGKIEMLSLEHESYSFESDEVKAVFNSTDFKVLNIEFKSDSIKEFKFNRAAEMYFLLKNLKDFSIFN
jgi:putative selenate reductase